MAGRPTGRPPKPVEEKRRTGNPGGRALPKQGTLVTLPAAPSAPTPARPLGTAGHQLWDRVWSAGATWLAAKVDSEFLLVICEQMDERQALRVKVLQDGDWRERAGLRALDAQIMTGLALLGFNPVDRSRLGVAEVRVVTALDRLRERRAAEADG